MNDHLKASPAYCGEPRPFDGRTYRVTLLDGTVFEPCHAMPQVRGNGVLMVVPAVNGVGGGIAGDLRDHHITRVECIGIHNENGVTGDRPEQREGGGTP